MKKLTPQIAKELVMRVSPQIKEMDQREFFLVHSDRVAKLSKMIGEKLKVENGDIDLIELETAGWIHDIGHSRSYKNHSQDGVVILEELEYEISNNIKDSILNHGTSRTPKTIYGKIIQIADKLSIYDIEILEIIFKHGEFPFSQEDIRFIEGSALKGVEFMKKHFGKEEGEFTEF